MFCSRCGTEFTGNFCQNCGKYPDVTQTEKNLSNNSKSIFKKWWFWVIVFLCMSALGSLLEEDSPLPVSNDSQIGKSDQYEELTLKEPYTVKLTSGHYTSGIDFPAGTYSITALSGSGNVYSDNAFHGGLNELMSGTKKDHYISEFKNCELPPGTVLSISGVKISISSDAADVAGRTARTTDLTKEVRLSAGNYIAGTDFPAGTYNVVAVSGSGNVWSSNALDGGLNEIMSDTADDHYLLEFKNVNLSDGIELKISGMTIKLVPSE